MYCDSIDEIRDQQQELASIRSIMARVADTFMRIDLLRQLPEPVLIEEVRGQ